MNEKKYLTKNYEEAKAIPLEFKYLLDKELEEKKLKELLVLNGACISLLTLDLENHFSLYYPFEKEEKLINFRLPANENPLLFTQEKAVNQLFAYTYETLALIYKEGVVKLFEAREQEAKTTLTFEQEVLKIVAYKKNFYLLLKDKSIVAINSEGEKLELEAEQELFKKELPPELKGVTATAFGTDCSGDVWLINDENALLEHYIKTAKYNESFFEEQFDSGDEYTVWSNLFFDWEHPEGTEVEVEVRIKGGIYEKFTAVPDTLLLYDYVGQVLELKVTLKSDLAQKTTPKIDAIKALINEKPYVEYLPAYYQEDAETLSRYLSIFQSIMREFETKIEQSHKVLNPQTCNEEYLEWLSLLLGLSRDYRWEEQKWRNFLSEAPTLYAGLGTKKTMQRAIELYCDEEPLIDDQLENSLWSFCVTVSAEKLETQRDIDVIESIIELFKPAHTSGRLLISPKQESFIVGQSSLDMNTTELG